MLSKYKIGMIGIRVEKSGSASNVLKNAGWVRMHHAAMNNRNAFDWVKWSQTQDKLDTVNVTMLSKLGMVGFAVWISDAQWGKNASISDKQWECRRFIG